MTLRGKALPILIAALLVVGPALVIASTLGPAPATPSTAMKRVPQHLMSREPGTGAPAPEPLAGPAITSRPLGTRSRGTDVVIVIPIDFTDTPHSAAHDQAFFDSMMNSASGQSVNAFYRENSYGAFGFQATVTPWMHSTQTMAAYGADGTGVDDRNGPIYRLVTEAVRLASASGVNFAPFDQNGAGGAPPPDGVVDHVVVIHSGGAQESSTNTNLIWSHRWAVIDADPSIPGDQRLVVNGVQVYGYMMISEDSPFGVLAHEFGHDLGLPDLYDTDGSSLGIGVWDVMSSGSWNGNPRGTSPSDFSAWSKAKLGWVTPIEVTAPLLTQRIPAVENNSVVYRLTVKTFTGGDEYFLVENREQILFDAAQPGSGLLIWHVDDSVQNNDNELHRLVDLEEADEGGPRGDHPIDPTDPWFSSPVGWGPDTNPNSNGYGNIRTGWKVRNIGPAGLTMTADLSREVDDDLAIVKITHPFAVQVGSSVAVFATLRNQGARAQRNVNASLRVYLNTIAPASALGITNGAQIVPLINSTRFVNLTWQFTASNPGRYILDARVDLAGDEIPENNERLAHVTARTFYFLDDVESGPGNWGTTGQSTNDLYRWEIVSDADPSGKSHSPVHAWRFGYYATVLPNLFPPPYHYLDSQSVTVPSRPLYLVYFQTYDLLRSERFTNETDDAYVEVMVGSGPWQKVAHFQGKSVGWGSVGVNLTSYVPTSSTNVRIRFNVTSNVMSQTAGGWWIDDIALTAANFSRAVAMIPVVSDRTIEPGAEASFTIKVANIGDFDDAFQFRTVLPSGWTAVLVSNSTSVSSVDRTSVTLAPDAESTLQFRVQSPAGVLRGAVEQIPLTVFSSGDGTQRAVVVVTARISDPLGLGGIQKYVVWIVVLGIALVVIVILVDHAKSRRFRGQIR